MRQGHLAVGIGRHIRPAGRRQRRRCSSRRRTGPWSRWPRPPRPRTAARQWRESARASLVRGSLVPHEPCRSCSLYQLAIAVLDIQASDGKVCVLHLRDPANLPTSPRSQCAAGPAASRAAAGRRRSLQSRDPRAAVAPAVATAPPPTRRKSRSVAPFNRGCGLEWTRVDDWLDIFTFTVVHAADKIYIEQNVCSLRQRRGSLRCIKPA